MKSDNSIQDIVQRAARTAPVKELVGRIESRTVTEITSLAGSAFALYQSVVARKVGGVHICVAEDRDAAAYLAGDLYGLADKEKVMFLPSSYKRSICYGGEDASSVVQRTAALEAVRNHTGGYLIVCTYPEALAECVVSAESVCENVVEVRAGERISMAVLQERVEGLGFERVDFVHEPGQYSIRGGIFDVFSYSENRPFRLDFFGDEVESLRRFDLSSQLSTEKVLYSQSTRALLRFYR